ncbi:MAG: S9 family peptidase [Terriglobia bacterium]|jgi:dipeptidyl aminopeptidase/acylaminoacyl peptidase
MLSRKARTVALLMPALLTLLSGSAGAQESSLDAMIDSLAGAHGIRQVAISPDGQRVAWVEANGASPHGIFVCSLASPASSRRRITAGSGDEASEENEIAWSPDSRQLAFLSNAQTPDQAQLYVAKVSGGEARRLTDLKGSLDSPSWSPDGKTLALLFTENAPRVPGPVEPMTPPSGVIDSKIYEQRLSLVDVATGHVRQLSPADLYVYEYDWSPDGKKFALTAAHGSGDANWYVAELYTLQVDSGELKSLSKPAQQIAEPRWSPDGSSIAFIGGLMSDEGSTGGDVLLLPATGGAARNLTPGLQASVSGLVWRPGGGEILLLESVDGASGMAALDVRSGNVAPLWSKPETLSLGWRDIDLSVASDGRTSATLRESFSDPPEVWAGPIGEWKQIATLHQAERANWGKAESIHWTNEGLNIQGWLTYPLDYDPSRRYPLLVEVHGGPGAMARPTWPGTLFDFTLLSRYGYFVLRPNPRGSFGQGEAFTRANVKDFGYGDLRDILAGVDYVVEHFPVDNDRVGIGGWSYGGYMTMWAVTQTHRFRASVAGAGIANWQSYYGENDIDQWMIPFFGASVYDDPAVYAKSSPITFIKNVKTPTLILVGDRDGECPIPQSFEFWHALETLGVENQFVVYPNEGHMIFDAAHRQNIMQRTLEWYDRHLK